MKQDINKVIVYYIFFIELSKTVGFNFKAAHLYWHKVHPNHITFYHMISFDMIFNYIIFALGFMTRCTQNEKPIPVPKDRVWISF